MAAKLTVPTPGILITHLAMTTPWDDVLDLSDRQDSYWKDVISGWPCSEPTILNHLLKCRFPLRRCQEEGVIFAKGCGDVPSECDDHTPLILRLVLSDALRNELCFDFEARVDRWVKRKYEKERLRRLQVAQQRHRVPIFSSDVARSGAPKEGSLREVIKQLEPDSENNPPYGSKTTTRSRDPVVLPK